MSAVVSQDEDCGVDGALAEPVERIEEPTVGRQHNLH
jgi:hypothetical protein